MSKLIPLIAFAVSDDDPTTLTFTVKSTAASLKPIKNTKGEAKGTRDVALLQSATDDLYSFGAKLTIADKASVKTDSADWLDWTLNFIPEPQGGTLEVEEPAPAEEPTVEEPAAEAAPVEPEPEPAAEEPATAPVEPEPEPEPTEETVTTTAPPGMVTFDSIDKLPRHEAREQIGAMGEGRKALLFQLAGHPASPMLRKAARERLGALEIEIDASVTEVGRPKHDVRNQTPGTVLSRTVKHRGEHADWGECKYTVKLLEGGKFEMVEFTGNRTADFLKAGHVFGGAVEMLASFVGKPKGKHGTTIGRFFKLMAPRKAKASTPVQATSAEESELEKRKKAATAPPAEPAAPAAEPEATAEPVAKRAKALLKGNVAAVKERIGASEDAEAKAAALVIEEAKSKPRAGVVKVLKPAA